MPLNAYKGRFYKPSFRGRLEKKKKLVWAFVLLFFVFLTLGGLGLWRFFSQPEWEIYQNDELGIKFDWPNNFQTVPLSGSEKESGMVFKVERERPEAQVFLRVEKDLGPIRFTGKTILEYLVETIDRTYPNRFLEFQKEDQRSFVLAGQNAVDFVFTYKSPDGGTRIRQRYIVVLKDNENIAFFLSLQAPEKEFSKSEKDFERILESFEFAR